MIASIEATIADLSARHPSVKFSWSGEDDFGRGLKNARILFMTSDSKWYTFQLEKMPAIDNFINRLNLKPECQITRE